MLLTVLYLVAYTWATVPPMALFLGWQPDTKLIVLETIAEEYRPYVQSEDSVLAIDGRLIRRGQPVFKSPVQSSYQFMLQRGNEIFTQDIPVRESQLFRMWLFSLTALALAFWFIGFMTVRFARPQQSAPLFVGLGIQLIGAGIVSPAPSQLGAPGAWIVGNVLIFFFPLIMLYLGYLPRQTPLSNTILKILRVSFYILVSLAIVAAIEVVFWYPERSLVDVIGVESSMIVTILTGVSVVTAVIVLIIRLLRSPYHSYERQQLSILCVFLILSVAPLFFFVILPLGQVILVPFPFVYSLFLLMPTGYFFVLHRQGHLELDALFGRLVTILVLVMVIGMAYATGVYMLDAVFRVDFDSVGHGGFFLVLFGIAVTGQKQVQTWVDLLLYGHDPFDQDSFSLVRARLSAYPEPSTLTEVIQLVAARLRIQHVAVLVRDSADGHYRLMAGNEQAITVPDPDRYQRLCLRSRNPDCLNHLPEWVELSIPIKARGDMLGLFLLAGPTNGYFNARQVATLQDITDMLAISLLVINLVDALQTISRRSMYERELQRQRIATEIHNEPLQTLATVIMQLQRHASDTVVREASETVRQVAQDLRRIIAGLRPPVLKDSVPWITRQMVREFAETHDNILIRLHLADRYSDVQASETTKLAFYYIFTEILNNIVKHARASEVAVLLDYGDDSLALEVQDNGIGTEVGTRPLTELLRLHHMGVTDMYRWASIGQGTLEITQNSPSGTTVRLTLPTKINP